MRNNNYVFACYPLPIAHRLFFQVSWSQNEETGFVPRIGKEVLINHFPIGAKDEACADRCTTLSDYNAHMGNIEASNSE